MLAYIIKSTVLLVLAHSFYFLVLRNDRNYMLTRWYLLSLPMVFLLPLLKIPGIAVSELFQPYTLPEVVIYGGSINIDNKELFPFKNIIVTFYLSGVLILLFKFIIKMILLFRLYIIGRKTNFGEFLLVHFNKNLSPFTFFRTLFFPETNKEINKENPLVIHEIAHARQMHTIDLLLYELLSMAIWFHPSVWYLRKAVQTNHEYLADEAVLKNGFELRNYQQKLVSYAVNAGEVVLGNSFNQSEIVKRMKKMKKFNDNITRKNIKYVTVFGTLVIALSLVANSYSQNKNTNADNDLQAVVTISTDEQGRKVERRKVVNYTTEKGTENFTQSKEEIYQVVEEMPQFNGSDDPKNFATYVAKNLNYPKAAAKAKIEGKVFIQFCIDKNGKVVDTNVLRSAHPLLDAEAKRVINESPRWTPGKQKGKSVKVQYTIPVVFALK